MIGNSSATLGKMCINSYALPGISYWLFLTTSITDKPKSFWTFNSKLRQDNQGIGDLHVSGSIVNDDALKAEALNEQFNSVYTEEGSIPLPNLGESPYRSTKQVKSISSTRARRHPAMVSEYVCRSTSSSPPQYFFNYQ